MGLLNVNEWILDFYALSWGSCIFLLACLTQLQYEDFCFILLYFMSCYYLLEVCSFLMSDIKVVVLDRKGGGDELG